MKQNNPPMRGGDRSGARLFTIIAIVCLLLMLLVLIIGRPRTYQNPAPTATAIK
jgi:hypothetical protein